VQLAEPPSRRASPPFRYKWLGRLIILRGLHSVGTQPHYLREFYARQPVFPWNFNGHRQHIPSSFGGDRSLSCAGASKGFVQVASHGLATVRCALRARHFCSQATLGRDWWPIWSTPRLSMRRPLSSLLSPLRCAPRCRWALRSQSRGEACFGSNHVRPGAHFIKGKDDDRPHVVGGSLRAQPADIRLCAPVRSSVRAKR
jgi:hypothetical protein